MAKRTSPLWISLAVCLAGAVGMAMTIAPRQQTQQGQTTQQQPKVNVTGCLQKSTQGSGFQITDTASNTTYDATSANSDIDLSSHVGHTVTLTGTVAPPSTSSANPGSDTSSAQPSNQQLSVSNVKMVSSSCQGGR